jgi:hypothetical protein
VHRDKFPHNKTNWKHQFLKFILEWNSTCFGQFLCPSSGVIHSTLSNGICQTAFEQQDQDGNNSILILLLERDYTAHKQRTEIPSGLQTWHKLHGLHIRLTRFTRTETSCNAWQQYSLRRNYKKQVTNTEDKNINIHQRTEDITHQAQSLVVKPSMLPTQI